MTSAGGLVPVARRGRAAGGAAAVAGRPAACWPAPRRRWPTASPTPSPSTWAAPAPTCAWCSAGSPAPAAEREVAGLPGAAAVARRAHHRRRRRLDRPARRRRRARRRAPQRRAPCRARPATAAAAPSRRSPTPTWWPGASPPAPRFPGSARSTSTRPGAALDRGRRRPPRACSRWSTRPWSRRCGPCRSSGASIPAAWRWWRSAAPARCTPAPWPTRSACRR